jgi:hypothetical protein
MIPSTNSKVAKMNIEQPVYYYRSTGAFTPPGQPAIEHAERLGMKFGDKGTHTSRTIMLEELEALLAAAPPTSGRKDYARLIVDDNVFAKSTLATRKLSNQRIGELYGLDPSIGVFRVMRRLWDSDARSHPLLALLTALARDPLLRGTASTILEMTEGEEFPRARAREELRRSVGMRLNDSILDKVLRNAASSWTQSGHLEGRTFKKRRRVRPTPQALAFAFYLGRAVGFRGPELFSTGWISAIDATPAEAQTIAREAKRLGLIDFSTSADVVEIGLDRLDPVPART